MNSLSNDTLTAIDTTSLSAVHGGQSRPQRYWEAPPNPGLQPPRGFTMRPDQAYRWKEWSERNQRFQNERRARIQHGLDPDTGRRRW